MKNIIEFFLPFEDIRYTLIILVSTIALINLILFFLQRKQRLNICVCVKFEEYLISFFLAIVCFGFFIYIIQLFFGSFSTFLLKK